MKRQMKLKVISFMALTFIITQAYALDNNSNNTGIITRAGDDTLSQSQANPTVNTDVNNSTNNSTSNSYKARRNPVATAFAVAPLPSATCRSGTALGIQGMGFGITGGGDKAVTSCEINEAARIAATVLGDQETALEIFCQNEHAKVATACHEIAERRTVKTANPENLRQNANAPTN